MFDLHPLTGISKEIRKWIETLDHRKEQKSQKKDRKKQLRDQQENQAVECLSNAVLKTRIYIAGISSGNKRDNQAEIEIVQLWNQTHIALRTINPELAGRCFLKAEHWIDPTLWNDEKIQKYKIELDSMSEAVRNFRAKRG